MTVTTTARLARGALALLALALAGLAAPGARALPAGNEPSVERLDQVEQLEPDLTVALFAPRAARVTGQLRRELETAGFSVELHDAPAGAWPDTVRVPGRPATVDAVAIDLEGHRVLVLGRGPGERALVVRSVMSFDPADELDARRVRLAVVEHLRAQRQAGHADRAARHQPAPPEPAPAAAGQLTGAQPAAAAPAAGVSPVEGERPPLRPRPWSLAAYTAINFDAAAGEPTGHLQLVGETPLGDLLAVSARAYWPLVGANLQFPERHVRLWTMGAAGALRLRGPRLGGRLEPFVATALGLRFALADSDHIEPRQSRVTLTPGLSAGLLAGARCQLVPLVHLVLELGGEWSLALGGDEPTGRDAAGAATKRVALGVVFEY
jgi:hypothetical protein